MVNVFDPASIKILLVDDTPENLEIAGRILLGEGYDLYLADTGIRALELARQTVFDLILMDIMMPGWMGLSQAGNCFICQPAGHALDLCLGAG
jgi:CheY-like chemotaxis protein